MSLKYKIVETASDLGERVQNLGPGILIVGGLTLGAGMCNIDHLNRDTYQVKVVGTETKKDDGKDRYLVFTTDVNNGKEYVFENVDSTLEFKWNSSNLQTRAMDAQQNYKTCEIRAYGFRIPLWSSYKNMVEITCK